MKKITKLLIVLLCGLMITAFLIYSQEVKSAIYNAIVLCGKSVIPSLFPIFFITLIIANSGAIALVPKKSAPLFLFILSMVSGYPVGAKLLSTMVRCGQLRESTAEKILPSMVCAGPAFIINIAGSQIFSDSSLGVRLYICQFASNLIIFIFRGGFSIDISIFVNNIKAVKVITNSVKNSVDSLTNICAYVILFSAFSSILAKLLGNEFSKYFLYIFEVTGAVFNSDSIYITCAVLSWSGVCVIFQVLSVSDNLQIKILPLITTRIISAGLSCALLKISFIIFPYSRQVISNIIDVPKPAMADNFPFLVVFVISLFVLLMSLTNRSTGKFFNDIAGEFD